MDSDIATVRVQEQARAGAAPRALDLLPSALMDVDIAPSAAVLAAWAPDIDCMRSGRDNSHSGSTRIANCLQRQLSGHLMLFWN